MVYYMVTAEDDEILMKTNMNIRSDDITKIREELYAKYPLSKSLSGEQMETAGIQNVRNQRWMFEKDFNKACAPIYAERKEHGQKLIDQYCSPLLTKKKADLVKECAIRMKAKGIKEAYVLNWTYSEGSWWFIAQSWYVYEEGGQYFFKMHKQNKAKHLIEGVN